ncbi:protein-ER retention protein [Blastocladiella emersonii ATCC 22665]|nr:protein-ER retention protein [Blastocladiella emersonii ATCC 22665]
MNLPLPPRPAAPLPEGAVAVAVAVDVPPLHDTDALLPEVVKPSSADAAPCPSQRRLWAYLALAVAAIMLLITAHLAVATRGAAAAAALAVPPLAPPERAHIVVAAPTPIAIDLDSEVVPALPPLPNDAVGAGLEDEHPVPSKTTLPLDVTHPLAQDPTWWTLPHDGYRVLTLLLFGATAWAIALVAAESSGVPVARVLSLAPGGTRGSGPHPSGASTAYQVLQAVGLTAVLAWIFHSLFHLGPVGVYLLGLAVLLLPVNIAGYTERMHLVRGLIRIFTPSLSQVVNFSDVLLADFLTSFARVFADIYVSFGASVPAHPLIEPVLISLPYLVRFRQCIAEWFRAMAAESAAASKVHASDKLAHADVGDHDAVSSSRTGTKVRHRSPPPLPLAHSPSSSHHSHPPPFTTANSSTYLQPLAHRPAAAAATVADEPRFPTYLPLPPTPAARHLANAIKYASALPVIFLSAAHRHYSAGGVSPGTTAAWLVAGLVNTLYSFYWDVFLDWSLGVRPPPTTLAGAWNSAAASHRRTRSVAASTGGVFGGVEASSKRRRRTDEADGGATSESDEEVTGSGKHHAYHAQDSAKGLVDSGTDAASPATLDAPNHSASDGGDEADPSGHPGFYTSSSNSRDPSPAPFSTLPLSASVGPTTWPVLTRPRRHFRARSYYVAIVADFILRFLWALRLSSHVPSATLLSLAEVGRRGMWCALRIEREWTCSPTAATAARRFSKHGSSLRAHHRPPHWRGAPDGVTAEPWPIAFAPLAGGGRDAGAAAAKSPTGHAASPLPHAAATAWPDDDGANSIRLSPLAERAVHAVASARNALHAGIAATAANLARREDAEVVSAKDL